MFALQLTLKTSAHQTWCEGFYLIQCKLKCMALFLNTKEHLTADLIKSQKRKCQICAVVPLIQNISRMMNV